MFSNGIDWKVRRRFCLRHLKDLGFGKSSMESIVIDEFRQPGDFLRPQRPLSDKISDSLREDASYFRDVELDSALNAAVANVIWILLACEFYIVTSILTND